MKSGKNGLKHSADEEVDYGSCGSSVNPYTGFRP
jgi:hypothetical protein